MRTFTILFTLFYFMNALAVAPYGIQGQNQSTTLYSNVHKFPNSQVTNLGGINALVETGNKNILANPSFEHSTFSTNWTSTGTGSFFEDVGTVIDGKKSAGFLMVSQTINLTQDSTAYAGQFADGVQGLVSVRVKANNGATGIKVCSRQAAVTSTTNCVNVVANGKWGLYKVPTILGSSSNGISIASTGNVTSVVYVDDAFVGAVDLQASVDSSKIAGESYFAGTAGCNWPRSTTTLGAFTATAGCPGPTVVYSSMGQWQTTDSDLPRQTINNLPAGNYKATFIVSTNTTAGGQPTLTINDGTTSCESILPHNGSAQNALSTISCSFSYNSTGNRVFELFGSSTTGSLNITNSLVSPRASTKFILEYFGSSSVYSSTNADTDWTNISNVSAGTFITATTTNPSYGTVATNKAQWKRQGSDLLLRWDYRQTTAGGAGSGTYLINIPSETGCSIDLTKAPSSAITSPLAGGKNSNVGTFYYGDASNDGVGQVGVFSSTQLYVAFIYAGASSNRAYWGSTAGSFSTSTIVSAGIDARIPCANWQNSNIIIGQFNGLESCSSTLDCTDTFSAKISSAGVVSDENVNWINGNCSSGGTGFKVCSFNTNIFTVAPNCQMVSGIGSTGNFLTRISASSSSSATFLTMNTVATPVDGPFEIICQKQGVDYIGKTAKAVASDQNTRMPGILKNIITRVDYGGSTFGSSCTASPCSFYNQRGGSWITSMTRSALGDYTVTLNTSYWANITQTRCWITSGTVFWHAISVPNSSGVFSVGSRQNISGYAGADSVGTLYCEGEQQ